MLNKDLTVIYYTANRIKESFAEKVRNQLLKATGDLPLISISKKPIDFGINICDGETERSIVNVYKAVLAGALKAKTKYIALAEDDTLYPREHFETYLPSEDTFAYNLARWSIYSWSKPACFSLKFRRILATLIAPRNLLIKNLEERFTKYPDSTKIPLKWMVEPGREQEKYLGITPMKAVDFYSKVPVVVFSHPYAFGYDSLGKKKKEGILKAIEIPYWGKASDILKLYNINV